MRSLLFFLTGLLVVTSDAQAERPECVMDAAERAWVDNSLSAWRHVADSRLKLPPKRLPTIILFNSKCRFELASGRSDWHGEAHQGKIRLSDGNEAPAQVTSFAGGDEKIGPFFVMALPPIWNAAKLEISGDHQGLTAVFLHEFSHARQVPALKSAFDAANAARPMDADTSDDSLQKHFQSDPTYVAVIEKERDLLFKAAAEPDTAKMRTLAAEALALMDARQKRWFVGDQSYWKSYDDLFLTMEGFGQWAAYAWLADPAGGKLTNDAARDKLRSDRWWSQDEGLALFIVIDRLLPDWPQHAFADPPVLGIDLLRLALKPKS